MAIVAASLLLPTNYQICEATQNGRQEQCAAHSFGIYVLSEVSGFLDAHNGLLTAIATIFVALFTWTLWRTNDKTAALAEQTVALSQQQVMIEGLQANVLTKQTDIAQQQFFAAHPPRLVLKDVYFSKENDFSQLTVEFSNTGGGIAGIQGGFTALDFVSELRDFKHQEGRSLYEPLAENGFTSGSLRSFVIDVPERIQRSLKFLRDCPDETSKRAERIYGDGTLLPKGDLSFFGIIYYFDTRQKKPDRRACVFRRWYNERIGGFERSTNPDHEYSD